MRFLLAILLTLCLASPSWATISYGTASASIAVGTTSLSVAYPTTVIFGDLLVLCVTNKYPTNGPATPSGWTAETNGQGSGGDGTPGADDGSVYTTVYTKVADGTETGNVTVTLTSANSAAGGIARYRNHTGLWSTAAANGSMNTPGTAWSVTTGTDPGVTTNDWIITCSGTSVDTATFTSETITQTGMTFAGLLEVFDGGTTQGDDTGFRLTNNTVTAGGPSSSAPIYAATAAASTGGSSVLLRIRELPSTPVAYGTTGTVGSGTTSATPAFPASVAAGDLLVMCVASKYPVTPSVPNTPTDAFGGSWAAVTNGAANGGADPDGAATGHATATLFYKLAVGTENTTASVGSCTSACNAISASISRYTKADSTANFSLSATGGSHNTADTTWSVTGAADNDVTGTDVLTTCSANASNNVFSAEAFTQTNVVFGTIVERADTGTTFGDDVGVKVVDVIALTGTSGGSNAPTFTATNAGSTGGATTFLRIRQVAAVAAPPNSSSGWMGIILK